MNSFSALPNSFSVSPHLMRALPAAHKRMRGHSSQPTHSLRHIHQLEIYRKWSSQRVFRCRFTATLLGSFNQYTLYTTHKGCNGTQKSRFGTYLGFGVRVRYDFGTIGKMVTLYFRV